MEWRLDSGRARLLVHLKNPFTRKLLIQGFLNPKSKMRRRTILLKNKSWTYRSCGYKNDSRILRYQLFVKWSHKKKGSNDCCRVARTRRLGVRFVLLIQTLLDEWFPWFYLVRVESEFFEASCVLMIWDYSDV